MPGLWDLSSPTKHPLPLGHRVDSWTTRKFPARVSNTKPLFFLISEPSGLHSSGTVFSLESLKLAQGSVAQSCLTLWDPTDRSPPGSSVHGNSPGNNPGVGCHFFLQGIFRTRDCTQFSSISRQILYCLSHQGSPTPPKTGPEGASIYVSCTAPWFFIW